MLTAGEIAHALGGKRTGSKNNFVARCPAHEDRSPSLSLTDTSDGRVLLKCHAGCAQADVLEAFRARGLWRGNGDHHLVGKAPANKPIENDQPNAVNRALMILRESKPIIGTLASRYLQGRGLDIIDLPICLRFHPALWHAPTRENWPAMLAPLRDIRSNEIVGVHRTYLARNGRGKAPIELQRMVLGRLKGACIKLDLDENVEKGLHVAEGIETALACMQCGMRPMWSLVSADRIRAFPPLSGVECLTIAADHDQAGLEAANACAEKWIAGGAEVFIRWPAGLGHDYADRGVA